MFRVRGIFREKLKKHFSFSAMIDFYGNKMHLFGVTLEHPSVTADRHNPVTIICFDSPSKTFLILA
ncbi:MAG: hypothetical protein ACI8RD_014745 [Bacillariaceae sp.]|jgi:hypothetical protein